MAANNSNKRTKKLPPKPIVQNLPDELQNQKRRSSSRSIKRKRFDDEIVEYSLSQQSRGEQTRTGRSKTASQTFVVPVQPPPSVKVLQPQVGKVNTTVQPSTEKIVNKEKIHPSTKRSNNVTNVASTVKKMAKAPVSAEKRRRVRSQPRRTRRTGRPATQHTLKNLGRWKPIDDLALIIGVLQTNDLRMVHRGTKFSCKFTLSELQARWFSLLYEPAISRIAISAMRNLHPEMVECVKRRALYSTQEEMILGTIRSSENPKLEQFQELLQKNASVFYAGRTAKTLQNHWQMMKQYHLLPDQVVKPLHASDQPLSFSDAEDLILDAELNEQPNEALEIELALADRQHKRQIRLLENELGRWNVLVDSLTYPGLAPEFDGQTLAVIRGRLVRYLMRSKEISFGRDAKDSVVDVDLCLEGPATKISRRQGTIKLRSNGDFFISNEGKRPIFVNGVPILRGNKTRLANNCVLEICDLIFVFLVNYDLINAIRHESAKTTSPLN